jgi:hypothetical protein
MRPKRRRMRRRKIRRRRRRSTRKMAQFPIQLRFRKIYCD